MFYLEIAEHCFLVNNRFEYVKRLCEKYTVSEDKAVNATVIEVSVEEILAGNTEEMKFPPAYLESLAIYRKICSVLAKDNVFLFHCSAIAFDGCGVLFTAPSGTGKSTHRRLWQECFGERVTVINDDKPLLKVKSDGIYVCGTPWCGKHGIETNTSVKIKAVALIERAEKNEVKRLSFDEIYPILFAQTHRPSDPLSTVSALKFINLLAKSVETYKIKCNISEDAALVAKKAIFG
jgi:hypothetical protein